MILLFGAMIKRPHDLKRLRFDIDDVDEDIDDKSVFFSLVTLFSSEGTSRCCGSRIREQVGCASQRNYCSWAASGTLFEDIYPAK